MRGVARGRAPAPRGVVRACGAQTRGAPAERVRGRLSRCRQCVHCTSPVCTMRCWWRPPDARPRVYGSTAVLMARSLCSKICRCSAATAATALGIAVGPSRPLGNPAGTQCTQRALTTTLGNPPGTQRALTTTLGNPPGTRKLYHRVFPAHPQRGLHRPQHVPRSPRWGCAGNQRDSLSGKCYRQNGCSHQGPRSGFAPV